MSRDIQILPMKEGEFDFAILGAREDSGLMLLQRVFLLLLSDGLYRDTGLTEVGLLSFLEGGNYPDEGVMNSLLGACCSNVLSVLDDSDRECIAGLTGEFVDRKIICTLTFNDGTSLTGVIDV